jgi:hypothetical protein
MGETESVGQQSNETAVDLNSFKGKVTKRKRKKSEEKKTRAEGGLYR